MASSTQRANESGLVNDDSSNFSYRHSSTSAQNTLRLSDVESQHTVRMSDHLPAKYAFPVTKRFTEVCSPDQTQAQPLSVVLQALAFWCAVSWAMIVSNKILLISIFPFPLTLMVCHTMLAVMVTAGARGVGWLDVPSMVAAPAFILRVAAIGLAFALSIGLSSLAAKELSVPVSQMVCRCAKC